MATPSAHLYRSSALLPAQESSSVIRETSATLFSKITLLSTQRLRESMESGVLNEAENLQRSRDVENLHKKVINQMAKNLDQSQKQRKECLARLNQLSTTYTNQAKKLISSKRITEEDVATYQTTRHVLSSATEESQKILSIIDQNSASLALEVEGIEKATELNHQRTISQLNHFEKGQTLLQRNEKHKVTLFSRLNKQRLEEIQENRAHHIQLSSQQSQDLENASTRALTSQQQNHEQAMEKERFKFTQQRWEENTKFNKIKFEASQRLKRSKAKSQDIMRKFGLLTKTVCTFMNPSAALIPMHLASSIEQSDYDCSEEEDDEFNETTSVENFET